LLHAQQELLDFRGTGLSILEISHRSPIFEDVMREVETDLREVYEIPSAYKVLFLQGGASLQFAMLPMNLMPAGHTADYIVNGAWGKAALMEAQKIGMARLAGSSENTRFDRTPQYVELNPGSAYLHFTSNETIQGVQFWSEPVPPQGVPLACDMSSDFLSRPIDISKYGVIYAGAQKNAGPAGVAVVILHEDLLQRVPAGLPAMLDYKVQVAGASMYNTPPCFTIYMVGLVLKWLKREGGVSAIHRRNRIKAELIYDTIDNSGDFYRGHALRENRSLMNITFSLPTEALDAQFVQMAEAQGMVGLKGHRSLGGLRASLYNALPLASAVALAQFMAEFHRING
jgi:phosphoserine aminotransferase